MQFKVNFSKLVVVGVIALVLWFTCQILDVVKMGFMEPTVLIGAFMGFCTVELWSLASIKKNQDKNPSANDNIDDGRGNL